MTTFKNEQFADPVVPASAGPLGGGRSGVSPDAWEPPDPKRAQRQEQLVAHYLDDLGERIDDDYLELLERLDELAERVTRLESLLAGATGHECGDRLDELERAVDEFAHPGIGLASPGGHGIPGPSPEPATVPEYAEATAPLDDPMTRLALSLAEPDALPSPKSAPQGVAPDERPSRSAITIASDAPDAVAASE